MQLLPVLRIETFEKWKLHHGTMVIPDPKSRIEF
jgi:hypothetical protein